MRGDRSTGCMDLRTDSETHGNPVRSLKMDHLIGPMHSRVVTTTLTESGTHGFWTENPFCHVRLAPQSKGHCAERSIEGLA
jgi:hypothetical protein